MKKILVTGTAGFIGFHLTKKLLAQNQYQIVGLDMINDYYDINLKFDRLNQLGFDISNNTPFNTKIEGANGLTFYRTKLEDKEAIAKIFAEEKFDYVVNLAAQAGVRYSLENPHTYIDSNVMGFLNILEGCRHNGVQHLIYASSSSVYGLNDKLPFSVKDNVDHPISLYAASKKANELMAHTYSNLFKIPTTGLRFFTVYGPWGRPDMALFIFAKSIMEGKTIDVFNNGEMQRDFTYVDDIVESISRLVPCAPAPVDKITNPSRSTAPYTVFNIGNNSPVRLMDFVHAIEEHTGIKADINYMPLQPGDVPATYADVQSLFDTIDFKPQTTIKQGISNFVKWYREYYKV
ncbi:MAG: NAD-dependent epimerase [Sphingobacteriales bacterium]|nr:MAG: NAD-dependent epimerase [Sphingobacteriales bacterium]